MPFLGVKISKELETLIDEEVKRSDKSKSDIVRDALNQYFNVAIPEGTGLIVLDKNELIQLIDSRLGVKPEVKQKDLTVKPEVKLDVKPAPPEDPVTLAKRFILAELEAGMEPTAASVAEAVEMDPKRLGTLLGRAGIKARSVHRGGKKARRYTLDMKESIERLAAR
jgi:hypothetical protein